MGTTLNRKKLQAFVWNINHVYKGAYEALNMYYSAGLIRTLGIAT